MQRVARDHSKQRQGQALTESILLLPLFLFIVFALLQFAQLGIAVVLSHYAASSIARKAANDQSKSSSTNIQLGTDPVYFQKADSLMVMGIHLDDIKGCISTNNGSDSAPTGELIVAVRSKVEAWPFFSMVMNSVIGSDYAPGSLDCGSMQNVNGFGPINFSPQTAQVPYYFYITGKAKVRLNYMVS